MVSNKENLSLNFCSPKIKISLWLITSINAMNLFPQMEYLTIIKAAKTVHVNLATYLASHPMWTQKLVSLTVSMANLLVLSTAAWLVSLLFSKSLDTIASRELKRMTAKINQIAMEINQMMRLETSQLQKPLSTMLLPHLNKLKLESQPIKDFCSMTKRKTYSKTIEYKIHMKITKTINITYNNSLIIN